MTDELKKMEKMFEAQKPGKPSDAARKAAFSAAMHAFEKENQTSTQGNPAEPRLTNKGNEKSRVVAQLFNWRRLMKTLEPKFAYAAAGGVSLAVLAAAMINVNLTLPYDHSDGALVREHTLPTSEAEPTLEEGLVSSAPSKPDLGGQLSADKSTAAPSNAPMVFMDADRSGAGNQSALLKVQPPAPGKRLGNGRTAFMRQESPAQLSGGIVQNRALTSGQEQIPAGVRSQGRDQFSEIERNPQKLVSDDPVSTFSVDVDTTSYAFTRAALNRGELPQKDAVRVEEMVNYFDYDYTAPTDASQPFSTHMSIMPTPWNEGTKLLRIGIKGFELPPTEAPNANLVFLIDTSGSMEAPNKLPLLRNSFKLLLSSLKPDDTVSIVVYAGSAGTVLEPTQVADNNKIMAALDQLDAGGSTAGAEGIRQAYQLAESQMVEGGVNRVILATDGDFNVGLANPEELKGFVERKRKTGVSLSVLGFGQGNYNDELMQTLAQNGNGNAAYIDTLSEARKVLVEEAGSTLFTIAKDVKLQMEFNPALVDEYRLIGYETRILNREDFNNDKIDAGDIGAGHTVTALYELTPVGSPAKLVDELRYGTETLDTAAGSVNEYGFLKIRYKLPESQTSELISVPVTMSLEVDDLAEAPNDAQFATSVAAFGQLLAGGRYTGNYSYDDVIALAQSAKGTDEFGYRSEFINLVRLAKSAAAMAPQQ
ncbi:MAG: VWA domain-containing protein [Hyphomicrobiales bacterium]